MQQRRARRTTQAYQFHLVMQKPAGVLLRGPGRVLPRHPQGPALHAAARDSKPRALGADRAVARHQQPAAADGADPVASPRRKRGRCSPGSRTTASSSTPCTQIPDAKLDADDARRLGRRARSSATSVRKRIEEQRIAKELGSSLQAEVDIRAPAAHDYDVAGELGDDLQVRADHVACHGAAARATGRRRR